MQTDRGALAEQIQNWPLAMVVADAGHVMSGTGAANGGPVARTPKRMKMEKDKTPGWVSNANADQ